MTNNAALIKAALRLELEKQGASLEDFEKTLSTSSLHKTAAGWLIDSKLISDMGKGLLNASGLTAVGVGGLAGYGGYKAYKGIQDTDSQSAKMDSEKQQYIDATRSLLAAQHAAKNGVF